MNRNDEFTELMKELDGAVPEIGESIKKGMRRKARKQFLYQPLLGLAAVFVCFVLSVNFCAPVAYACSKVPVLKDLAKAVTFSKSLSTAVENEFVQEMNLRQTKGDITAEIAYLIVDQKQVNVFYRFASKKYGKLNAHCEALFEDGEKMNGYSMVMGEYGLPNEELRCASMDFHEEDVPGEICFRMDVFEEREGERDGYLEQFDFLLNFDPTFTAEGKKYPVNQTFVINGQTLIVTEIEVYPTHMRVNVTDVPENTAWFKGLTFYVETEEGERFSNTANGMVAFGSSQKGDVVSYYAESPYFYEAEHLKMVVTGADWLDKGKEETWVNIRTGETGPLPEDTRLKGIERDGNGRLKLVFEQVHIGGETYRSAFGHQGYDENGNLYNILVMMDVDTHLEEGEEGLVTTGYVFEEFPYEEVRLELQYSECCRPEKEIIVELK